VRTLEGALIRVVAYGSLTRRSLDESLTTEVLDGLYPVHRPTAPDIEQIKSAACAEFGVSGQELVSAARAAKLSQSRQLAMYLARELTDASLPAIGRAFGGRDHSTVLHALRRAAQRIESDADYRARLERLRSVLTAADDRRS
jgi:chromosomal replication initiator protein